MKNSMTFLRTTFIKVVFVLCAAISAFTVAMPSAMAQAEAAGYLGSGNDTGASPPNSGGADTGTNPIPPAQQGTAYNTSSCVDSSKIITPQTITSFSAFVGGPISSLQKETLTAALGIAGKATPFALALGGGFALLTAISDIMFAMVKKQSVWEPAIGTMIMALLASFLLLNYGTVVGFITGEVQDITVALTGSPDALGQIIGAFTSMIGSALTLMGTAFDGACTLIGFFQHIVTVFLVGIVLLITLFFIFYALVEILSVIIIAPLMVAIGAAVGPIFVGLIASRWTQKWFLKWIEFMLAAAIINLLVGVSMSLLVNLFNQIKTSSTNGMGAVMSALGLMVISLALGKFFQSIPGLASAMVPGHHGMSGGGSAMGAAAVEAAAGAKAAGGGGGGGAAGVAAAPSAIKAAAAPMRVAAAAIGGPAAVAAVGAMASTAQAATSAIGKGVSAMGGSTASAPGSQNSAAMSQMAGQLPSMGSTATPPGSQNSAAMSQMASQLPSMGSTATPPGSQNSAAMSQMASQLAPTGAETSAAGSQNSAAMSQMAGQLSGGGATSSPPSGGSTATPPQKT